MGYALIVIATSIFSGRLLDAVGEDRSAAALARVIQNVRPRVEGVEAVEIVGVGAFPPSLSFYLRRTIPIATATGRELTSRSEEHTSELQSRGHLVCRLLLEKKKKVV